MRVLIRRIVRLFAALVLLVAGGNAAIAGSWLAVEAASSPPPAMLGVENFRQVDEVLWRGDAPSADGYRALAESGVKTVVDLRAEGNVEPRGQLLSGLGVRYVRIPVRDGQAPSPAQVEKFLEAVSRSDGVVFVHCGAGVGRAGAMTAAYLAHTGKATGAQRVRHNLSVGPPSLEQLVFAATAGADGSGVRPAPVVAVSRVLDAPRRAWSRWGLD